MAWINGFREIAGNGRIQPSHVEGLVKIFDLPDGARIVQIDTQGSADRANPGKQSQTIQLGREAAGELFDILKRAYRFS
jgi:hypothetical protein